MAAILQGVEKGNSLSSQDPFATNYPSVPYLSLHRLPLPTGIDACHTFAALGKRLGGMPEYSFSLEWLLVFRGFIVLFSPPFLPSMRVLGAVAHLSSPSLRLLKTDKKIIQFLSIN